MESGPAICSLQDIFEAHCAEAGIARDDPIVAYVERLRSLSFDTGKVSPDSLSPASHPRLEVR